MANAYVAASDVGVLVAVAIALHNIPEEFAMAVPTAALRRRRFLIRAAVVSALAEPVGAVIGLSGVALYRPLHAGFLALAAGAMIYVSLHEMLPLARQIGQVHQYALGAATAVPVYAVLHMLITGPQGSEALAFVADHGFDLVGGQLAFPGGHGVATLSDDLEVIGDVGVSLHDLAVGQRRAHPAVPVGTVAGRAATAVDVPALLELGRQRRVGARSVITPTSADEQGHGDRHGDGDGRQPTGQPLTAVGLQRRLPVGRHALWRSW